MLVYRVKTGVEDGPRMLQNEMEKSLESATLVTAAELICV